MSERNLGLKENIVWNSIGNFIYLFSQWILTYIVARFLSFEDVGIFSLAMSIGGSLSMIALYTMRNFQVSDVNSAFSDSVYIRSRYFTSAIALLVCILFVLINGYSPLVSFCIVVYMIFKLSEAISDVYQGVLQKNMRMDYIGKSFIIKGILILVAFVFCIMIFDNLLIALIAMFAFSLLIVVFYDRKKAHFILDGTSKGSFRDIRTLLLMCLPVAIFGFLFNTMGFAPRYFLEILMGAEALGYYASVGMPVVIVQVSASFVFAPLVTPLAQYLNEGKLNEFRRLFTKAVIFLLAIALLAILVFFFLGDWFIVLLFGAEIVPYTYLIMPLVFCTILVAASWFLSTVLIVLRELKGLLVVSLVSFLIVIGASAWSIGFFGMNGASFVLIAACLVFVLGNIVILLRAYKKTVQSKKLDPDHTLG